MMSATTTLDPQQVNVALVGAGAFGAKHLAALSKIPDVRELVLVDTEPTKLVQLSNQHPVSRTASSLEDVLSNDDIDAVILATPTPLHVAQAIACLKAGKHVQVEIPLAESLEDALAVELAHRESRRIAMVGHTRRFNPSHRYIRQLIREGAFQLQHLVVETFFFRRENLNALGEPRDWADNLLWHHAAHTVDLFLHQTESTIAASAVLASPADTELGIPLDMSIQLKTAGGALCTLALSFNNDGPLGTTFRYIGTTGTYVARYDDLTDGYGQPIDVSRLGVPADGIEGQDREFISAIRDGREPESSVSTVLACYHALERLQASLPR